MGDKNSNNRFFGKGNKEGKGRPKLPPEIQSVKRLSKDAVERVLSKIVTMGPEELVNHLEDPKNSVLEHIVGRVAMAAIATGDPIRLNFLLERLIGKAEAPEKYIPLQLPPKTILRKGGKVDSNDEK